MVCWHFSVYCGEQSSISNSSTKKKLENWEVAGIDLIRTHVFLGYFGLVLVSYLTRQFNSENLFLVWLWVVCSSLFQSLLWLNYVCLISSCSDFLSVNLLFSSPPIHGMSDQGWYPDHWFFSWDLLHWVLWMGHLYNTIIWSFQWERCIACLHCLYSYWGICKIQRLNLY